MAVVKREFNPHGGPLPMMECDKSTTTSLSFRYAIHTGIFHSSQLHGIYE